MAAISLESVSKRFGATVVADALSLDIADGEFFVFLGPSGGGKSTLLHMIAGAAQPSAGRIRIGGIDVTDLPPQRRDVAMVFQTYALYPHFDVAENIAFPLRNRGVPSAQARAEVLRVAESLGLADLLHRRPRDLSGGQRQRVALARALVRRPAVFLMDEPLSNLDATLRLEIRDEMKRLHQRHRVTTVYVTHDQEEALALAARVAVLHAGRIQQCGTPGELYARPSDVFVARFVGTPPMNLLPASELAAHPAVRRRLAGRDMEKVTVGIRPHAVMMRPTESREAGLEVALVEPAGPQTWVVAGRAATSLKGRLAIPGTVDRGGFVDFEFAPEDVHLFDTASGRRID